MHLRCTRARRAALTVHLTRCHPQPGAGSVAPPFAPRAEVLSSALSVSLVMAVLGGGARNLASQAVARGVTAVPDLAAAMPLPGLTLVNDGMLLRLALPEVSHLGWALAAAAGVTLARVALLAAWPSFRDASEAANQQARARAEAVTAGLRRLPFASACAHA
jgi:hypothetical protein